MNPKKNETEVDRTCANCKNRISAVVSLRDLAFKHHYRGRQYNFCSWSCMRKWQRERGQTVEQLNEKMFIKRGDHDVINKTK